MTVNFTCLKEVKHLRLGMTLKNLQKMAYTMPSVYTVGKELSLGKTKQTTSMLRHRYSCPSVPALHLGKFNMEKMREPIAHWILMHEHPFSIVKEEDFNIMLKHGMSDRNQQLKMTVYRCMNWKERSQRTC